MCFVLNVAAATYLSSSLFSYLRTLLKQQKPCSNNSFFKIFTETVETFELLFFNNIYVTPSTFDFRLRIPFEYTDGRNTETIKQLTLLFRNYNYYILN